tara:strand:- start:5904 stop:6089 length:186 start_codon:yes stop_codon:yes gene_type:complete
VGFDVFLLFLQDSLQMASGLGESSLVKGITTGGEPGCCGLWGELLVDPCVDSGTASVRTIE